MTSTKKLAVIGTAGRNDDAAKLAANPSMYLERMMAAARAVADRTNCEVLVSGGAGWADHVAILLFLNSPGRFELELYLPAALGPVIGDPEALRFDEVVRQTRADARSANGYHSAFLDVLRPYRPNWSPFKDLHKVSVHPKARIFLRKGYSARNAAVAMTADVTIAMTFGNGRLLKGGGTSSTMKQFLAGHHKDDSYHLDLSTVRLWQGAETATRPS